MKMVLLLTVPVQAVVFAQTGQGKLAHGQSFESKDENHRVAASVTLAGNNHHRHPWLRHVDRTASFVPPD